MHSPVLLSQQSNVTELPPILIIDQRGEIAYGMWKRVKKELPCLISSSHKPESTDDLIYVPYEKPFPDIPDEAYSLILLRVSSEKEFKDLAPSLLHKSKTDNIPCIFILPYTMCLPETVLSVIQDNSHASVIVLGDLFGSLNPDEPWSGVDALCFQAGIQGLIQLPDMGLGQLYPVSLFDVIHGILQGIFGNTRTQRVQLLMPRHPVTVLSLAHIIQKYDPEVHLDFLSKGEDGTAPQVWQGEYLSTHDFAEKLHEFYKKIARSRKAVLSFGVAPIAQKPPKKSFLNISVKKSIGWALYVLTSSLILPVIFLLAGIGIGEQSLLFAQQQVDMGKFNMAGLTGNISNHAFIIAEGAVTLLKWETGWAGGDRLLDRLQARIQEKKIFSETTISLSESLSFYKRALTETSQQSSKDIESAQVALKRGLQKAAQLQKADLSLPHSLQLLLGLNKQGEHSLFGIIDILPEILGMKKPQTFLVVFQNETELRPGGGVIEAYGLWHVDHGRFSSLEIENPAEVDKKLTKQGEPPYPIRRYIGQKTLLLRDSNFSVDTATNGVQIASLFKDATGVQVDGIITINNSFVQKLLHITGEVSLPGFTTPVSDKNFIQMTQSHLDFPEKKKEFLSRLLSGISEKLSEKTDVNFILVLEAIIESLRTKHVQFMPSDPKLQNLLIVNNITSSLWDTRFVGGAQITDFLGISEANLGVNAANIFINRQVKQDVVLDDTGGITENISLLYQNNSRVGQWPGGEYKTFVRLIVPDGAVLTSITINGKTQTLSDAVINPLFYEKKGFQSPPGLELSKTNEQGKVLYGFVFTVPPEQQRTVTISYQFSHGIDLRNPQIFYDLKLLKQPGTGEDPYMLTFTFPSRYLVTESSSGTNKKRDTVFYIGSLVTDNEIRINLQKKRYD